MPTSPAHRSSGFAHVALLVIALLAVGTVTVSSRLNSNSQILGDNENGDEKQEEKKQEETKKAEEKSQEKAEKAQEDAKKSQEESKRNKSESKSSGESGKSRSSDNQHSTSSRGSSRPTPKTTPEIEDENDEMELEDEIENEQEEGIELEDEADDATDSAERETETESPDGTKIKTKIEDDGTTKLEMERGELKLKIVTGSGRTRIKAENEAGEEVEIEEKTLSQAHREAIEALEIEGVKLATGEGKPRITARNVDANTDFPISIDLGTNRLILTTPAGEKTVAILPDQVVNNLLTNGTLSELAPSPLSGDTLKLELKNNELVYRVRGKRLLRIFGLIPLSTQTTAVVSAETGGLLGTESSPLTNLLSALSR